MLTTETLITDPLLINRHKCPEDKKKYYSKYFPLGTLHLTGTAMHDYISLLYRPVGN